MPKATGFESLVWVLPMAALVCAAVGLFFAFRRWRSNVDAVPDDADRELVAAALAAEPDESPMNPDDLAELEEERRFLLTSIRDLEREHEAGDVDEHDFTTLRDGYVARAAAVLREIDDGHRALPSRAERPWWRRLAVPVATLVVAGRSRPVRWPTSPANACPARASPGARPPTRWRRCWPKRARCWAPIRSRPLRPTRRCWSIEPDNVEAVTYRAWLHVLDAYGAGDMAAIEA